MTHSGVYFLANDCVLDLTVTFLDSFRKHNPVTTLCLVPFAADNHQLKALAENIRTIWCGGCLPDCLGESIAVSALCLTWMGGCRL